LNDLIGQLGLWGFVHLPGPFDDVEDFLRAADVFVLPSLEEGMSLALLEAMAMGLPVVASSIAANSAIVEDGVTGRLAPVRDSERLAEIIMELFANRDLADRLGQSARAHVSGLYSLDRMITDHLELFQRLLAT
jgi:glycosyltransferase involved in cell wall biosynthesis